MKSKLKNLYLLSLCLSAGLLTYIVYKAAQPPTEFTPVCGASRKRTMQDVQDGANACRVRGGASGQQTLQNAR